MGIIDSNILIDIYQLCKEIASTTENYKKCIFYLFMNVVTVYDANNSFYYLTCFVLWD